MLTSWVIAIGVFQDDCGFRVQYPRRGTLSGARVAGCWRQGGCEREGAQGFACIADIACITMEKLGGVIGRIQPGMALSMRQGDIHAIEDDTHNVMEGMAGHAAQNGYVAGFPSAWDMVLRLHRWIVSAR